MDRGKEEKGFLTPHQIEFLQGGDSKHERQARRRIRNRLRGAMWDFRILAENMPVEERQNAIGSPDVAFELAVADAFRVLWSGLGQMEYQRLEQNGVAEGERDLGNDDVVEMEIEYEPVRQSDLDRRHYTFAVDSKTGEVVGLGESVRRWREGDETEYEFEQVTLEGAEGLSPEEAADMALRIAESRHDQSGKGDASGEDSNAE